MASQAQYEAALQPQLDRMKLDHVVEKQDAEAEDSPHNHSLRKRKFGEPSSRDEEDENQHLKVLLAATEEKLKEAQRRSQVSATQAGELEKRNARLYNQIKQYKAIMLDSGGKLTEDIPDEKLAQDFVNLREQVQHIVNEFFHLDIKVPPRGLTAESADWLKDFAQYYDYDIDSENLRKRFRGLIFGYLNTDFFIRPIFGIQSGEIQDGLSWLEEKMLDKAPGNCSPFEICISANNFTKDHYTDLVEWRRQTIKCISLFDDGETEARNLAKNTYNDLRPFIRSKRKSPQECFDQFIELYTNAQNLALLMRGSRHLYKIEAPYEGADYIENESVALGREIFDNSGKEIVGYPVSPALFKFPDGNLENRITLERAHVVTSVVSVEPQATHESQETQETQETLKTEG